MQKSYVKNAAILTVTGLALRMAGMFFRVYIAGKIGAEGMGVYQLIFTVYSLAVTLATAGLSIVSTRIIAGFLARRAENEVYSAMRRLVLLGLCTGISATVGLFFAAKPAALYWLHDARAILPLCILAPSLPFMAASAILRGYFMARREVSPNARAQIFEQILRIVLVAALLTKLGTADIAAACMAIVFGNTVSEAFSWFYMHLCYRRDLHTLPAPKPARPLAKLLFTLLSPLVASQYVTGILHTIENVLVPNCLAIFLASRDMALAQYGALKAMAMPVLFFPFSFLGTLTTLLLPEITEAFIQKNAVRLHTLITRVLLVSLTISGLAAMLFTVFSHEIGMLLYQSEEIGLYLRVLGPLAPLMYLESMVDGILKGLDEQVSTFRYTVADSFLRIFLIALLLPRFGMKGFLFIMVLSNIFTSLLNLQHLLQVTHLRFAWANWLFKPLFAAVCGGFACRCILVPLCKNNLPMMLWFFVAAFFCSAVYVLCLFLTGCISTLLHQKSGRA
ncbi:MAG: polysaccharide biosynthesis C-terminal domain-containing protein [Ruthenibacterium sp.]